MKKVQWRFEALDASANGTGRNYNCTTIIFENRTGGSDIILINNTWTLYPGWLPLYLKCLPGEIDINNYQFVFVNPSTSTSILQIAYK